MYLPGKMRKWKDMPRDEVAKIDYAKISEVIVSLVRI